MADTSRRTSVYPLVLLGWLLLAIVLGATGQVGRLRPPAPQLVLAGLTIALLLAGWFVPGFRLWIAGLNIRQIVAVHLLRFVGIYFLILYARGELPYAFAVPGGWGDIVIATGALILVLFVPDLAAHRGWVLGWNTLGLADILFVAGTASRLAMAEPESMHALLRLPLSLLPTFVVPIIIATHVWLFQRLRTERTS